MALVLLTYFCLAALALTCHYMVYHILYTTNLYRKPTSKKKEKKQPAWLPYTIPYLGHSVQLLTDPYRLLKSAKHPVRLRLPGMNPFLIQGVDNVRRLLKAASDTNPAHAQNFIASQLFGMPASAAKLFEQDDSGYAATPRAGSTVAPHNRICYRDRKLLLDMFQGRELECVISRFRAAFDRRMAELVGSMTQEEGWHEMPDLWEFLTTHVTPAAIEALCGSALVQDVDGDFVRDFWAFDAWVPAITKGVPAWLSPRAYRVRDKLLDSLVRWRSLDWQYQRRRTGTPTDDDKGDAGDDATRGSPSMMAKMDLLEVDGWSLQAIAASDLGLIWASNSNTISAIYWLSVETFRSRERLRRIRAECLSARRRSSHTQANDEPALGQGTPSLDIDLPALLTQPYLQACFAETLRLRTHIFITRFVDARDMDINEWSIPARSVSLTCSSVPHMDAALWSVAHPSATPLTAFAPERFLTMPIDPSSHGPARRTCKLHACDSSAIGALGEQPLPPSSVSSSSSSSASPAACECAQQFSTKGLDGIWIPFGGGAQMCPGRKLAKAETFLVTAVLTSLFDIELCKPDCEIPVKSSHFGTGVSKPAAKTPFRIRRRRRQQQQQTAGW